MFGLLDRFAGNSAAAPVIFLVLFLVIVGAALYITPRLAAWLDRKDKVNHSFYEGMLTEDPAKKKAEEDAAAESAGEAEKSAEEKK